MNRILEAVRAYFNAIENPTEQERHIQMLLAEGFFPITSICRDDLKARGFDADKATDEQMQELARKMANDYCEQLYWDSMEIIAELMGIPKRRVDFCPKCESELVYFDVTTGCNRCSNCGQEWDNNIYALVVLWKCDPRCRVWERASDWRLWTYDPGTVSKKGVSLEAVDV